jgi:hypothetical protein
LEIEKARVLVSHIRTSGALALDIEELEFSNVNSTSTLFPARWDILTSINCVQRVGSFEQLETQNDGKHE